MRIRELRLIRYGKFTDLTLSLPAADEDIHLIVGPNEAGKSTVRTAIGDWLFGIPARTPLAFLHPMPDLRIGGLIEKPASGDVPAVRLAFDRTKGNRNTLHAVDGAPLSEATLREWLPGLDAQSFNQMYALDHATMVKGGAGILSASDDIGRMLFQSAAGIEHLGGALQALDDEASALWAPRKSAARVYYQAQDAAEAASAAFRQAALRNRDWKALHDSLRATEAALALARQRDTDIRRQLSRFERIRRVRPLLLALDAAIAQREATGDPADIPLLPEDAAQVLDQATRAMVLIEADQQRLQEDAARLRSERDAIAVDEDILSLAGDVTELNERRLQFRAHRTDMVKRTEELRIEWSRARDLAVGLGWPVDSEDAVRQRLPAATVRARLLRALRELPAVAQALRAAQDALGERQQQIRICQQALALLSSVAVHPGLAGAVEQARRLGDHAAVVEGQRQQIAALDIRIDTALAALGAWRRDPDVLKTMLAPDITVIHGLIDQHRGDLADEQSQQEAVAAATRELQRLELELEQLVRDFQPVSLDQVQQARRLRDAEWQSIKAAPESLSDRASVFEGRVIEADHLADARLDRARHEAARRAKHEGIEQQRLALQTLLSRVQTVRARIERRLTDWQGLADACGLPALPLELAPGWLQQRRELLGLLDERTTLERQMEARLETAGIASRAIWSLLDAGESDAPPPDLAECVRRAQSQITAAGQAEGERATLTRQLRDAENSLATLSAALRLAQESWDAADSRWRAALASAGYDTDAPVSRVEPELETMQEIERLLGRVRSIRSDRIETMQADLDGLASAAGGLAARIAPAIASEPADDIVIALFRRLDIARQAQSARSDLQSRCDRTEAELAAVRQRELVVRASLVPLMTAAGVTDVGALGTAIERSDQCRAVARRIESAEAALAHAADGLTVDALRSEIAGIDPDALKGELDRLAGESAAVVEEIASHSHRYGTVKLEFEALDGADTAARADARRQEANAAMADAAERYLKLRTAWRLLRWSLEKFRETRQGPMLANASAMFSTLTLGAFSRLLVDGSEARGGAPRLLGIRPDGAQVDVGGMSEGARDQLYLALRLSALGLQVEQGFAMPLIADDLFINFDDRRTAAGLRVLADLSRRMQVVCLTHHEHLIPLARTVLGERLNIVRL